MLILDSEKVGNPYVYLRVMFVLRKSAGLLENQPEYKRGVFAHILRKARPSREFRFAIRCWQRGLWWRGKHYHLFQHQNRVTRGNITPI